MIENNAMIIQKIRDFGCICEKEQEFCLCKIQIAMDKKELATLKEVEYHYKNYKPNFKRWLEAKIKGAEK